MRSMKKIVSCILCLTLVVTTALGISTPVMAKSDDNDGVEQFKEEQIFAAGSSFGEATDISVNSIVTGNLESDKQSDYYKFSTDSDGYVSFDFSHVYVDGDVSRWTLRFYDVDQNELIAVSFNGNVDESKTVTTQSVGIPAGTYYLCVEPYGKGYAWGSFSDALYHVCVNFNSDSNWETELNNKISQSDYIRTNNYYHGSIKNKDDVDYFNFEIDKSGVVNISFQHDYVDGENMLWTMTLYDENENEMISYSYYGNVPEEQIRKTCNIGLSKGKYLLEIEPYGQGYAWGHYSNANYSFCVDYVENSSYETEWNNLFSTADIITTGQTITGNIMPYKNIDDDYYYFENDNDGIVLFEFTHDYVEGDYKRWVVSLYDVDENELWTSNVVGNNANAVNNEAWLAAGKYYVKISPYNSFYTDQKIPVAPYQLTVNFDDSGDGTSATMYRLYNPNSGEHFYTGSITERNNLTNVGWKYEGVAWHAPFESGTPVYRLYNPNTGDHHYTTGEGERDHLSSVGWKYEGIGWYSDESETTALHRLYNPNAAGAGSHHYTTNMEEADNLTRIGWKYEGVGWYGV